MQILRWSAAILGVLALGGCVVAPPPGPSIAVMPGQGKNFDQFRADDASCRQYAAQQTGVPPAEAANNSLVGSAALGTALGAAAGAAIGAAAGNPAAGAAIGAGSGLALGTASGAGAAQYAGTTLQQRYDISYAQCMTAKGNTVPQPVVPQTAYAYPSYPAYPAYPYYGYGPALYGPPAYVGLGFGFGGGRRWHRWH